MTWSFSDPRCSLSSRGGCNARAAASFHAPKSVGHDDLCATRRFLQALPSLVLLDKQAPKYSVRHGVNVPQARQVSNKGVLRFVTDCKGSLRF